MQVLHRGPKKVTTPPLPPEPAKHTRRWLWLGGGLLAVGVLAVAGWLIWRPQPKPAAPPSKPAQPTVTAPKPAAPPDPLTIEAITARTYTATPIVTEQDLGDQGGYHNYIVSYHSDGLKIYALQSVPDGTAPAGGWPVVIFNHGYIDPSVYQTNDGSYHEFIAAFARAGLVVIKPDYRGNGKSEGVPEGGHFSPVYAYDVLNLIASLKQDSLVNGGRIGLFGHSMGGHVALRAMVASRDVRATVFMASVVGSFYDIFYNWPHSPFPNDHPQPLVQNKKADLVQKYGDPKANPTFWDSASAVNFVSQTTGAVQVNHDVGDTTVPKGFSDHLVQNLQQAGKSVDYYTYPGDDHQFASSGNRALILQRAVAFYQAHL